MTVDSRSPILTYDKALNSDFDTKNAAFITYANAQFNSETHEGPARANTTSVTLAQEEVERHQILSTTMWSETVGRAR